jgi:RNA polymerase sigma factor (TIGR02999 family)
MRRILIESARRRSALKRGSELKRVPLDEIEAGADADSADKVLALDVALSRFARHDPVKAKLVELRYFGGLTIDEAAESLEISTATANRYWAYARAWLQTEIGSTADSPAAQPWSSSAG